MSDKMKDELFEDVKHDDSLFEDTQYDDGLFEEEQIEDESLLENIPSPAYGAAGGLALQKGAEKVIDASGNIAEDLAFSAIGGESTPAGKKFLKNEMKKLGLPEGEVTPKKLGREVLDSNLLGKAGFKSAGDAFKEVDSQLLDNIKETDSFLSNVEGSVSDKALEKKYKEYLKLKDADLRSGKTQDLMKAVESEDYFLSDKQGTKIQKDIAKLDKEIENSRKKLQGMILDKGSITPDQINEINVQIDELTNKRSDLEGKVSKINPPKPRNALELEKLKRESQRQVDFSTPDKTAKQTMDRAKSRTTRELTEELVKNDPNVDLEELKRLRSTSGRKQTIRSILLDKSLRDQTKGLDIDIKDIGTAGVAGPGAAIARRGLKSYGASTGAKILDTLSKIGKSKPAKVLLKGLPIAGAYLTYDDAKAAGLSDSQALALTAADEATDVVAAVPKMAGQLMMGDLGQDEESKIIESNASGADKVKAAMKMQTDTLQNSESSDVQKEFARTRLESLVGQYKKLQDDNKEKSALVETRKIPEVNEVESVIEKINGTNNPQYMSFLPALNKAKEGSSMERVQAQFELMQQPAFRKMMKDLE